MAFDTEPSSFSLEDRILCPDGCCTGIIGATGKCTVCGTSHTGEAPMPTSAANTETGSTQAEIDSPKANAAHDDDDDERICCSDATCIGIIGSNGLCGTCGKPT